MRGNGAVPPSETEAAHGQHAARGRHHRPRLLARADHPAAERSGHHPEQRGPAAPGRGGPAADHGGDQRAHRQRHALLLRERLGQLRLRRLLRQRRRLRLLLLRAVLRAVPGPVRLRRRPPRRGVRHPGPRPVAAARRRPAPRQPPPRHRVPPAHHPQRQAPRVRDVVRGPTTAQHQARAQVRFQGLQRRGVLITRRALRDDRHRGAGASPATMSLLFSAQTRQASLLHGSLPAAC